MYPFKPKRIFLDYASATPVVPSVKKVMDRYLSKEFYNPSAIYKEGQKARLSLEGFRTEVARNLEASYKDIIFTSGGTESDNLAILGVFEASKEKIKTPRILISAIEHPGIKEAAKEVIRRGGEVFVIPVDEEGKINPESVARALTPNTVLISIMLANNETGVIEPISRIARLVKEERKKRGSEFPYFHTDASQAVNYLRVSVASLGVDLLTLDASKMYGPKGVGILYIKSGLKIFPILFGGGQEKGLRPGTPSLSLVAGFTQALKVAIRDREKESKRLSKIKDKFSTGLKESLPEVIINTPETDSLPNIISISVPDMMAEFVAIKMNKEGVMVSTGSSCGNLKDNAGTDTVVALGREDLKESTIRFSMGKSTKLSDVLQAIKILKKTVQE